MSNLPEQIHRVKVTPGISDHNIAYLELTVKPVTRKQQRRKVWLYNKAHWHGLADYLKPRFDRLDKKYHPSPDEPWTEIKTHLLEGMVLYIPCRTTKRKQLTNLKPNKAAGPDGISPRVYKELASVLAGPLTDLFQLSLDKGVVPSDWKKATVCPIFKKGEKYDPVNYRPDSLISFRTYQY